MTKRIPTDETYESLILDWDRAFTYYNFSKDEKEKEKMTKMMVEIGEELHFRKEYYDKLN